MTVINFTVQHDQFAASPDNYVETDEGTDLDVIPLIGWVFFSPETTDVLAPDFSPRPAGVKIMKYAGYINTDGRLRAFKDGPLGVRLPANDPVFGLTALRYRVDFDLRTPAGQRVPFDSGYFDAPAVDSTVWLAQAMSGSVDPAPDFSVLDGGFSDSYFSTILDSGGTNTVGVDIIDGGVA